TRLRFSRRASPPDRSSFSCALVRCVCIRRRVQNDRMVELSRPLPDEPCVIVLRSLALTVLTLVPDDALEQDDRAGEVWTIGKQMSPRDGGIKIDRKEQTQQPALAEAPQSGLDETLRYLAALAIGWIGYYPLIEARELRILR